MLAGVGLLPGVQHHVLLQVPLQPVALLTVRAGEGTLPAVTHLMGSEALCRGVVLPTLLAAEGFLLCVDELVFLQVTDLVELLPAAGAPVPPLSDPCRP